MSNRKVLIVAFIGLSIAVGGMIWQRWPAQSHDDAPTAEQVRAIDCRGMRDAGMNSLDKVIDDLERGVDSSLDEGLFVGYMRSTLTLCFPRDPHDLDNNPANLIELGAHPTVERYERLKAFLKEGLSKSTIGQPWRGGR